MTLTAAPLPLADPPGPSAQTYSALASVLAGFAFTALVLYLQSRPGDHDGDPRVRPPAIVATLFYAMSALTICAFLYGRLAAESEPSGRTYLGLSLYGVVLGSSVLSLFYALNLVMVTHPSTRFTAMSTRWVVAGVGPAVIVSLLADLLANAWAYGCDGNCPGWRSPRVLGFVVAGLFLVTGLAMTTLARHRLIRYVIEHPVTVRAARPFRRHPGAPALITLVLASAIGILSLWARGLPDRMDPHAWTYAILLFGTANLAVFAFATGNVLYELPPRLRAAEDAYEARRLERLARRDGD